MGFEMRALRIVAACVFVVCFPLLLLSSSLLIMVGEIHLYEYGFDKYDITEVTGLERSELIKGAEGLIGYFNGERDSPQVQVAKDGREIDLFKQREIDHLRDVKGLIDLFRLVLWVTLGYVVMYIVGGFAVRRKAFLPSISRAVLSGSVFTLALFAFVGIWALVDFQSLFLKFHLTSFQNDLWILDPSKHYLIMMFPEEFFGDAAMFLVGGTVLEAVVMGGIAATYLVRRRKGNPTPLFL
ncbi:MAG: TIGR01906 family membrane protein [Dehalococcoidia bacterium]